MVSNINAFKLQLPCMVITT